MTQDRLQRAASACNGRRARSLRHVSGPWPHIRAPLPSCLGPSLDPQGGLDFYPSTIAW